MVKKQNNETRVFILNKAFEGDWNDKDGNISHEIIDFFRADDGNYYVYNSPYGNLRTGIFVDRKNDKYIYKPRKINDANKSKKENNDKKIAKVEYLIIASNAKIEKDDNKEKKSSFYIKYVIKLKRRIHNPNKGNFDIEYGGKSLHNILNVSDDYPLVTFEAEWIKESKEIKVVETPHYVYQRNRGYVYSDLNQDSYEVINKAISGVEDEDNKNWEKLDIKKIDKNELNKSSNSCKKTFLDLIGKFYSEECYTNILYNIFSIDNGVLFKKFLEQNKGIISEKFMLDGVSFNDENYTVKREKGIKYGRMDISAESKSVRVFIENKVLSDLNGIKDNKTSQITTYYNWANDGKNAIGFVFAPNYRVEDIKKELNYYDEGNKCFIITYKDIYDFLEQEEVKNILKDKNKNKEYYKYSDDLPLIFERHSYSDKLEKFRNDFIDAINDCK